MQKIIKKVLFALIPVVIIFLIGAGDCSKKSVHTCGKVLKKSKNFKDTLYSGTTKDLYGLDFISPGIGSVVGQTGTILKTLNGGLNWSPQTSGTGVDLKDIRMLNKDTAVAVGKSGTILRTSDKGVTWGVITSPVPTDLNAICFTNSVTGFIAGNNGVILKSVNSGLTWIQLTSNTTKHLYDIDFSDAGTGCAAGETGRIMRTTNAGATWDTVSSTVSTDLYSIDFLDARGMSVGAGGKIISTTNAGANWVGVASPTTNNLRGVKYCLPKLAYAVGDNGTNLIYRTAWSIIPPTTSANMYAVNSYPMQVCEYSASGGSVGEAGAGGVMRYVNPVQGGEGPCSSSSISFEHEDSSCTWCIKLNGFSPGSNQTTPFTKILITCTSSFVRNYCNPTGPPPDPEMIYGEQLHDAGTNDMRSYNINPTDHSFSLQVKPSLSGPTNYNRFQFYLMSANCEDVCYIELDDIVCCNDCNDESKLSEKEN